MEATRLTQTACNGFLIPALLNKQLMFAFYKKKSKNKIRRRIEWVALRKDQIPLSISLLSGLLSHQNSTAKGRRSSQLGGRCAINAFSSKLKLFLPIRKKIIFLAEKALHWVQCFEILCCPLCNESKRSSCPYVMCKPSLGLIVPGFGSFFWSLPRKRKNYIQYVFSPLISKGDNKFCKRVYSLKNYESSIFT